MATSLNPEETSYHPVIDAGTKAANVDVPVCHGARLSKAVTSENHHGNVRELPAESTPAILDGLGIQQHLTATALSDVARIRKEAHAEIGRLISFLDQSDEYVMTELEEESEDEGAQCQGGGGEEGCEDEGADKSDGEPSLGSCDPSMGGGDQTRWAAGDRRDLEDDPTESGIAGRTGSIR